MFLPFPLRNDVPVSFRPEGPDSEATTLSPFPGIPQAVQTLLKTEQDFQGASPAPQVSLR